MRLRARLVSRSDRGGRSVMKTLFLNPPSYDDFDGGAGSRYQATREVWSFWYPTWLCYPAGLVPNSRVLDAPPEHLNLQQTVDPPRALVPDIPHSRSSSIWFDVLFALLVKDSSPRCIV